MADEKELKIVINGDSSGAESALGRIGEVAAGLGLERVAEKVLDLGKAFIDTSINAFAESERLGTQLNAVLKSTGEIAGITADSAIKLSQSLESTTTFSDEAVLSAENLLLTFTNIGKDIFPQATETVLDMATALGEDTKSASIQLGKALQDPILGVTALRRVGVNFNEDQKKVIEGLVKSGQSLEAQKMILKELATEFGGSSRAAVDTYAGRIQQLKNTFDNLQETIGKFITSAITPLATALNPIILLINQFASGTITLNQVFEQLKAKFPELTAGIKALQLFFQMLANEIKMFMIPIVDMLQNMWMKHHETIMALGQALAIILGAAIILVVSLLGGLIVVVVQVIEWFLNFIEECAKLVNNGILFVQNAIKQLSEWFTILGDNVKFVMDGIVNAIKGMVNSAIDEINRLINAINSLASKAPGNLKIGNIPKLATGGFGEGLTMVGERGPELVNLPAGSYVNNATQTQSKMGGPAYSVVINNPTVRSENDIQQIVKQVTMALGRQNELVRLGVR